MGRPFLLAAVLVAGTAALAVAGPKKKVQIDTTPTGAQVYLNAIEDGVLCSTPCSIDADVGETTLIVDLVGHKPVIDVFTINKKDKGLKKSYKLVATLGKIIVTGPRGAAVAVDDEDKGKAPVEIEVPAGTHAVVMTLNSKQIYGQAVEVTAGDEVNVEGSTKTVAEAPPIKEDPEIEAKPAIRKPGVSKPRAGSIISVGAAFTVGFRDFTYKNPDPMDETLTPESEGGQVLAGPVIELWPGTLAGVRALRGLALVVRYQHKLNSQTVVKMDKTPTDATTYWRSFEVSLRQRWMIKQKGTLEVGAGFVKDDYTFAGNVNDIRLVPDAAYQAIRIGGRASLLLGKLEPYLLAENRIVLSGGALEKRFSDGASANGLRGALGASVSFGSIGARLEGSFTRYNWTFKRNDAGGADGASDTIKLVSLVVGYAY